VSAGGLMPTSPPRRTSNMASANGRGGRLNLLDLMVYAAARRTGLPILCTGADFAASGAAVHPASRGW
jgi:ribonuclease VapC